MKDNFTPYVPDKKVNCVITKREAVLLSKLRKHQYGKFLVHKIGGKLIRIEINDSQLIEDDQETDLF
jgi:hypothetical protein